MKICLPLCIILVICTACSPATQTQRAGIPSPSNIIPSPTPASNDQAAKTCIPAITPAAFFPDSSRVLGYKDQVVQIYNLAAHQIETSIQAPGRVTRAAIAPDGQTIAWALEDFSIQLVRVSDQTVLHTLTAHTGIISGLEFSPAGDRLLTASEDTWVRIWALDGQQVNAFQPAGADNMPSEVMGIGLSSNWDRLATLPFNGIMQLWSLQDQKLLGSFEGVIQGAYSNAQAAFSPDGQYLAQHLGAGGGYLSLWRIADGKLLLRGENITTGVAFSPEGSYLAYGEALPEGGGYIRVRSPNGEMLIHDLKGPEGSLPGAPIFSPDGRLLAAVDYFSTELLVWDMATGKQLALGENSCP